MNPENNMLRSVINIRQVPTNVKVSWSCSVGHCVGLSTQSASKSLKKVRELNQITGILILI